MQVRSTIFTDYGQRFLLNSSPGRASTLDLWSAGLSISATIADRWDMRITSGWMLLKTPNTRIGDAHVNFSIGLQF